MREFSSKQVRVGWSGVVLVFRSGVCVCVCAGKSMGSGVGVVYRSKSMALGSSTAALMVLRKVTASRPSIRR